MRFCKVFGPNRTKSFHVKHFGTILSAESDNINVWQLYQ